MGALSPFPAGYLIVEIYYSGAWVDISADVTAEGVTITRGQPNEGPTTATPSAMTVQLLNPTGTYSPRNPRSPLYGLIGRGTPIRVSVKPQGLTPSIRYVGRVYEWPVSWGLTGSPSVASTIVCSGLLRQLSQSAPPNISPATRTISLQPGLIGYWPLEDTASVRFDAVVGADVPVDTGITLSDVQPWAGSKALPTMTSGRFTGNAIGYTSTGEIQFRWLGRLTESMSLGILMQWGFKGGTISRVELEHFAAGAWTYKLYDIDGNIFSNININGLIAGCINSEAQFALEISQVGSDVISKVVYILPGQINGTFQSATSANQTIGTAAYFKINPNKLSWAGNEIGHVSISKDITTIFDVRNQIDGYPGESATARAQRIAAEESIPLALISNSGFSPAMGAQPTAPALTVLAEVLAVGQGMLYETRAAEALTYRTATGTYNQGPKLSISYTDNLVRPLDPVDDDQNITNIVTITGSSGGSITVTAPGGPLASAIVGEYDTQITVNVANQSQLTDQAAWRLARGTHDESRWPRLGIDLAHPTLLSTTALTTAALAVDIGDRIRITNLPPWLPPDPISQRVIGITEAITPQHHRIEFNCDPYALLLIGVYEAVQCRYSGQGTVLAAAVTATSTALSIAPPPGVTWTSVDGNYTIVCGGEKMTVTNVTGNTMTVIRGIEGYSAPHPAGRPLDIVYALVRYSI